MNVQQTTRECLQRGRGTEGVEGWLPEPRHKAVALNNVVF